MLFSHISVIILAAVFLSACQPKILTAAPVPTVSIWQVQYTPATAWLAPHFQACAAGQNEANLVVSEHTAQALDVQNADFSFEWGERSNPPAFAAVIGQDQLALVVNPANPITSLSVAETQGLFSGKETSWSRLVKANCAACGSEFDGPIQAYGYAPSSEMQLAANWIASGPESILAPDAEAVVAAVAIEPFSIGYVPARWLNSSVKQIEIAGAGPDLLNRPVLAMAPAEPQGAKRAWLLCLQDRIK